MSTATPLTDDERLIGAARALKTTLRGNAIDYSDGRVMMSRIAARLEAVIGELAREKARYVEGVNTARESGRQEVRAELATAVGRDRALGGDERYVAGKAAGRAAMEAELLSGKLGEGRLVGALNDAREVGRLDGRGAMLAELQLETNNVTSSEFSIADPILATHVILERLKANATESAIARTLYDSKFAEMLRKLAERLVDIRMYLAGKTAGRAETEGDDRAFGGSVNLAGAGGGDPRTPFVAPQNPAPYSVALQQTFAIEFSITPATARSMVSESDAARLCTDEREAGGDQPMRLRITVEGGAIRAYRSGNNELGETVWINATNISVYFHGLSLDEEGIAALAFRSLTRPGSGAKLSVTPAASGVILSLGEF